MASPSLSSAGVAPLPETVPSAVLHPWKDWQLVCSPVLRPEIADQSAAVFVGSCRTPFLNGQCGLSHDDLIHPIVCPPVPLAVLR